MASDLGRGDRIVLGDRRILREGRFRWLRAILWMVVLLFLIPLAFGPTMGAIRSAVPEGNAPMLFLTRCGGAAVALGVYALLVWLGEDRAPREIAIVPALGQLLAGLALGVAMFGAVMAVLVALGLYDVAYVGPGAGWRGAGLVV